MNQSRAASKVCSPTSLPRMSFSGRESMAWRLPNSFLAQRQPESRVYAEKICVVTVFITCGNLVDPLPNHMDQGGFGRLGRSQVFQGLPHGAKDGKPLIHIQQEERTCVWGDLGPLESIMMPRSKSGRVTSFWLSPLASIYDPRIC